MTSPFEDRGYDDGRARRKGHESVPDPEPMRPAEPTRAAEPTQPPPPVRTKPSSGIWRFLARVAIYVVLFIAAYVGPFALLLGVSWIVRTAFSWIARNWPWSQIPATALTVSTLVILVLLIGVLIAHVVLLTRPFPRPKPTRLLQDYQRLGDLATAIHSAIDAGRRG